MTRGGRTKDRDDPERRCIVSGDRGSTGGLIRFVVGPDRTVVPDLAGKLPGRGIWVTADRAALETAVKKRLFARAARAPVTAPPDLADQVEAALVRRLVETIALARKAGAAVAGYEKAREWLVRGDAAALLQAADGSTRGRTKLRPPAGSESHVTCLSGRELGMAFGRENVIHAALAAGGLCGRVVEEAARLARLRGQIGDQDAGEDRQDA
ncbi:RNA-binding protein [Pararhodobacter sp. SW119]|uniref:RNA-binding protein n=1 Tax=Pararhodobacter sp. SW119 TaxID=2780075 RepID=UPI001AE02318|nr:RNA-binding protein [Pararhodobacter sp. SW119]